MWGFESLRPHQSPPWTKGIRSGDLEGWKKDMVQIVETTNEGLKRGYTVTIPAAIIAGTVEAEIKKVAPQVQLPGFRPGKVPANIVKKRFGGQIHQDALNELIRGALDKVVAENALRPATQPDVALGEGYAEGSDATLTVSLEVLPTIAAPDLSGLKLEKLVVPVSEAEVDEAVARIASSAKRFEDAAEGHAAANGDQLTIDFVGKLDGVEFDGGKAEDAALEIGAGRFIPGFEEQLTGVKVGDETVITVTFPEDYQAAHLAGKEATFDITVKAVKVPGEQVIDDEFAKSLGLTDLEQLKGLLRGQLESETGGQTRTQMKRQLLDILAQGHDFDVPPSMVEAEFNQIWQQLNQEAAGEEDPAAALAEIEAEKDDYRKIAVRRVRLGLLLSEIGQQAGVEISAQEFQMLVSQAAQQYRPEDRQRFAEYVQSEPMVAAQLRAPLYEEKVVDYLFDKAEVTEREVTKEELTAAIEAEEGVHVHGPDCDHGHEEKPAEAPKKKAAAKKKAEAVEGEAEAAPKKKAPAKKKAAEAE
jgi:trigger factor